MHSHGLWSILQGFQRWTQRVSSQPTVPTVPWWTCPNCVWGGISSLSLVGESQLLSVLRPQGPKAVTTSVT